MVQKLRKEYYSNNDINNKINKIWDAVPASVQSNRAAYS